MIRGLLILCLLALPAHAAEEAVGALSQNEVSITANFNGSEIFVFGAVKREAPVPPDAPPLHVVVTVKGPSTPVMVRKKERTFGIWINRDSVEVDEAPSFYAIATTAALEDIMSHTERLRRKIGFDQVVRLVGAPEGIDMPREFVRAVIRIRENSGLYTQQDGIISLKEETLFSTSVRLPANLTEGVYRTRMFLLRGREVIDESETAIVVRKEGLERLIYTTAHERPLLYGILSIAVALFAGWLASEVFRWIRR